MANQQPLLQAEALTKWFPVRGLLLGRGRQYVHAVDGVNLSIKAGETLALVGESGSGKSTIGRLVLGLLPPTGGTVRWKGQDISTLNNKERQQIRAEMQIIFQDTLLSLNPRKTIRRILSEPLRLHHVADGKNLEIRVCELLETVGLTPPSLYLDRYPHELSGGQRQRIGIARAISLEPELIVADEPISSLDVSIQAQILNLMKQLQEQLGLSYLFITHDLSVARSIAHRVVVLYLGEVVEMGPVERVFGQPLHPYTKALLSATPIPHPGRAKERERIILRGELPSPVRPPAGCRFHTRCPYVMPECRVVKPILTATAEGGAVACHLIHPVAERREVFSA